MALGLARVAGLSMVPYLAPGDVVLVRYGSSFAVNDVVLIDQGERTEIKRVTRIEGSHVFVHGDNAEVSHDSRQYGALTSSQVIATVKWRLPQSLRFLANLGSSH